MLSDLRGENEGPRDRSGMVPRLSVKKKAVWDRGGLYTTPGAQMSLPSLS